MRILYVSLRMVLFVFLFSVNSSIQAQSLKVGINETISNNPYLKNPSNLGYSLRLIFKIKKFELAPFINGFYNTNENSKCNSCFDSRVFFFQRASLGINLNHKSQLSLKWHLIEGLSTAYTRSGFSSTGRYDGSEYDHITMDDLFLEGNLGIRYNRILNLPISLDLFLCPVYTINLKTIPENQNTSLNNGVFFLKPEFGIIFIFDSLFTNRKVN